MGQGTLPHFDFSSYIVERTHDFTGREWVLAEIDRWLADSNAPRYFIITGEPGIGKTAIAARLTQIRQLAAYHFCMARQAETLDPLTFACSVSEQLARTYKFARCLLAEKGVHVDVKIDVQENRGQIIGVQINHLTVDAPSATVAFNRAVLDPLRRLYADGYQRQMVVLVDALDEAVQHIGAETIVDVLANTGQLPEPVRFVLTSRPERAVLRHFEQRQIPPLVLNAGREENQADMCAYVRERLAASADLQARVEGTNADTFVERLSTASKGNFLYVVWVLRAVAEDTQTVDRLDALPVGLDGIYREFLRARKVGKDVERWRSYRPVLGVLATAREPLTAEQVGRFAGLEAQVVDDVLQDAQQFLSVQPGEAGARYQLYHQSLANFLSDKERAGKFWIDVPAVHRRIADEYAEHCKGDWRQCDIYGLRYLPAHLAAGSESERLCALLLDFDWLEAKFNTTDITALIADYDALPAPVRTLACAPGLVLGALRLSAHVLARDRLQLASQLLGRLLCFDDDPALRPLLDRARQPRVAPVRLLPLTASLTPPGGPRLRTLTGHTGYVNGVALSADGRQAVSASEDKTLIVWDLESGAALRTLTGHIGSVNGVVLSVDGRRAVSTSEDHTLIVWDLESGAALATFSAENAMLACVMQPTARDSHAWTVVAGDMVCQAHFLRLEGLLGQC